MLAGARISSTSFIDSFTSAVFVFSQIYVGRVGLAGFLRVFAWHGLAGRCSVAPQMFDKTRVFIHFQDERAV